MPFAIKRDDLYVSEEMFEHQKITVSAGQQSVRIDKFLFEKLESVSRNRVQNAIQVGCILVNGKTIKANYKIRSGDQISIVLPSHPTDNLKLIPENIPLDIVYEDDELLVINKPPNLVVHPGTGNPSGTLVNGMLFYLNNKGLPILKGNKDDRPGLVHRIDKDTSGLMVIAKTDFAMTHLAKQFFDHTIQRSYIALVWGNVLHESGTISGFMARHESDRKLMALYDSEEQGKHSVTHYELMDNFYYVSLIKCTLETGRTHQIRVHMKSIGHTIFNDARYGGDKILKGTIFSKYKQFVENCFEVMPRQALHAASLGFVHPTTSKLMYFEQPLPSDMENVISKWRNYLSDRKNELKK